PEPRPATPNLDDGDPAQRERKEPEAGEWQVEEGQQDHLEDAVVADDHPPRIVAGLVGIAEDRRSASRPKGALAVQVGEETAQPGPGTPIDLGDRFAAGGPALQRVFAPGAEELAP